MFTTTTAYLTKNRIEVFLAAWLNFLVSSLSFQVESLPVNVNQLLQCAKVFAEAKSTVHAKSLIRDKIYIHTHFMLQRERRHSFCALLSLSHHTLNAGQPNTHSGFSGRLSVIQLEQLSLSASYQVNCLKCMILIWLSWRLVLYIPQQWPAKGSGELLIAGRSHADRVTRWLAELPGWSFVSIRAQIAHHFNES